MASQVPFRHVAKSMLDARAAYSPARYYLLYLVRALLHFIVFAGIVSFLMWIIVWLDPAYDKFTGAFGEALWNIYYKTGDQKGTPILYGYRIVIILYQWCGVLAAIYAVATLGALPKLAARSTTSFLGAFRLRARAIAKWETPYHQFWIYWCGGLSVADLLVVAVYLTLHGHWFARLVQSDEDRLAALDEVGLPLPHSRSLARLERYALNFGVLMWPSLLLLFFPMAHVSFLADWLGTHYASMIRWHRWIGQGTMWVLSVHGILYYIYWGCIHDFWHYFADWSKTDYINNLAGSIAWFFSLALWATSIQWVRRHFFEIFYRFHIACFIMFVIFSTIHYGDAWTWWLPGLLVYAIDVVLRMGQSLNATTISAHSSEDSGFTTLEIKLARTAQGFKVRPNEELFLMIPQISHWQWHPFTVYEIRHTPSGRRRAIMHCKVYNAWTSELCRRSKLQHPLAARIAGPLGRRREEALWRDYSTVVLVGGGIGAIPILSMLKEIVNDARHSEASVGGPLKAPAGLRRVVFVWVSRHGSEFRLMDEELLTSLKACDWLETSFFVTTPLSEGKMVTELQTSRIKVDPKWLPLTHHWASPLRLSADRPAQARLGGWVLELLVATCVFAGGFFGTVLAYSYSADGDYDGKSLAKTFYWKTGVVLLAVQTVMILGLPYALVVLPVTLYNGWVDRQRRRARQAAGSSGSSTGSDSEWEDVPEPKSQIGLEVAAELSAAVRHERPNVFAVVSAAVAAESGHVGVFAGGPASLRTATNNAAYAARQKCNLFGRLVHYFDESHEL